MRYKKCVTKTGIKCVTKNALNAELKCVNTKNAQEKPELNAKNKMR